MHSVLKDMVNRIGRFVGYKSKARPAQDLIGLDDEHESLKVGCVADEVIYGLATRMAWKSLNWNAIEDFLGHAGPS